MNHFGFLVEDVESLRPVLGAAGASKVEARPAGRSFTDWRIHDPEGNPIDLSARGYNTIPAEQLRKEAENGAMCEVRRLVLLSERPSELATFYQKVFGMEAIDESAKKVVLTDGVMRLVIMNLNPNPRTGLYCYGVKANSDWNHKLQETKLLVSSGPDWVDEGKQQFHLRDPEGNLMTVFGIN